MFETIKKIFFTEDVPAHKTAEVPVGQSEENQDAKNISEPVISFIKTLENEPKRFKLKIREEATIRHCFVRYFFELLDNKTKETFLAESFYLDVSPHAVSDNKYGSKPYSWLTHEEWELLQKSISSYFLARRLKLAELKKQRTMKFAQKERKRLTEIYCKE